VSYFARRAAGSFSRTVRRLFIASAAGAPAQFTSRQISSSRSLTTCRMSSQLARRERHPRLSACLPRHTRSGARTMSSDPDWKHASTCAGSSSSWQRPSTSGTQWVAFEKTASALDTRPEQHQRLPSPPLAKRRSDRQQAGAGVLRQVVRR
jgi:hypothetical protein